MFKIEKGVPKPTGSNNGKFWCKYPFEKMAIGDSFEAPPNDRKRIVDAAYVYGKKYGKKFAACKTSEGTVRFWRVS